MCHVPLTVTSGVSSVDCRQAQSDDDDDDDDDDADDDDDKDGDVSGGAS